MAVKSLAFGFLILFCNAISSDIIWIEYPNTVIWEPGNYHIEEIDEQPGNEPCCTRVLSTYHGSLDETITYAQNLCLGPRSPFRAFSYITNPTDGYYDMTMKTADGTMVDNPGWTTWSFVNTSK